MLSSGNTPHLRAHARLRLSERRADRSRLHAEMSRDLAVIKTEVELRDDHRALSLAQPHEEPTHFHAVESRFDLVVAAAARDPFQWQERKTSPSPRASDRDHEEPSGEIGVVRGWTAESSDEGIV